mmetsp:Transcript_17505/g.32151  ORF Transcript_17505/g.32151 Transcript_17505/m.32151 type:complete len:367 (+) Transcript_17505:65-1165(+)
MSTDDTRMMQTQFIPMLEPIQETAGQPMSMPSPSQCSDLAPFPREDTVLQKDSSCVDVVKDELTEIQLEHIHEIQREVELCGFLNGKVQRMYKGEMIDSSLEMDVMIWCPERTNYESLAFMPCVKCGPIGAFVQGNGFSDSDYFVLRSAVRRRKLCVVAMQYRCTQCSTTFHGWHPDTLAYMPAPIAALFPVPRSVTSMEQFSFLRKTGTYTPDPNDMLDNDYLIGGPEGDFLDDLGSIDFMPMDNLKTEGLPSFERSLSKSSLLNLDRSISDLSNLNHTPLEGLTEADTTMAAASLSSTKRSIQFCSVCCGIRREHGQLVGGHEPNGFCPVKGRKATPEEKRELRRRRQKMRRAMSKRATKRTSC